MAASGIAEHDEARRRERNYLKKAYLQKTQAQNPRNNVNQYGDSAAIPQNSNKSSSYDNQVRYMENMGRLTGHDAASVDKQRREAHRKQMQRDYSAKLPGRYTSIDYMSQW